MHRTVRPLLLTAAVAIPALGATLPAQAAAKKAKAAVKVSKIKGPSEDMRWGPVQVMIVIKNKKITNVKAIVNPETPRSSFIDEQAVPMLKSEVLEAQSADIDTISGATMTSEAYIASLDSAIHKAHKKKLLK